MEKKVKKMMFNFVNIKFFDNFIKFINLYYNIEGLINKRGKGNFLKWQKM